MAIYNTSHIFGYGESQMIGADKNGKVENGTLTTISPLITYLASIQQEGTTISMDTLFALNIYHDDFIDFIPNSDGNLMQRFVWTDIDVTTTDAFTDELSAALPS